MTRKKLDHSVTLFLTSFAAGVLVTTALIDLLPEALEHLQETGSQDVFTPVLAAIIAFFLLERSLLWFHHHHGTHDIKPGIWMVTLGDGLHNFIDGVAIASMFMISPALGITTALAVAAHEIPQEIADFSILLSRGLSRSKALLFNASSALTAFVGALLTYFVGDFIEPYLGSITAFTAGMFIYIALSDLIPELHHDENKKETLPQVLAFISGILLVFIFITVFSDLAH